MLEQRTGVSIESTVENFKVRLVDHFIPGITGYFFRDRIKIDNGPLPVHYGKADRKIFYYHIVYLLFFHV